ncbi:hypothetical protein IJG66_01755 [Candidatus Saccharibacteria bacterium]|nr:hypothetical protein [Candidatus Saccharibacteria bacterium]
MTTIHNYNEILINRGDTEFTIIGINYSLVNDDYEDGDIVLETLPQGLHPTMVVLYDQNRETDRTELADLGFYVVTVHGREADYSDSDLYEMFCRIITENYNQTLEEYLNTHKALI